MKAYSTKTFKRWAEGNKLSIKSLTQCLKEIENGNIDANLGANLFKQRIPIQGKGKSGGHRVILALKLKDKAFFLYGFQKNQQDNLTPKELKAYKIIAKKFLDFSDIEIEAYIKNKVLFEINLKR